MGNGSVGRRWVLDANDGVMTTTGAVQGFVGAGADQTTVMVAASLVMVTGALSLAAGTFAEIAQERAHQAEIIEDQRQRLARTPEEERADLRQHYVDLGLDEYLAKAVADQLTQRNALVAHLETEYGIVEEPMSGFAPWWAAMRTVLGFITGAFPLTITVLFVEQPWRAFVAVTVVVVSLAITGVLSWVSGSGTAGRAIARSILTGLFVAVVSYLAGTLLEAIDQFVPQVDIDHDN